MCGAYGNKGTSLVRTCTSSGGHPKDARRLSALAAELVQLGLSLIVTSAPGPSRAMKEATATIPVVFIGVADPVGFGLVRRRHWNALDEMAAPFDDAS